MSNHPEIINHICEWTGKPFTTNWKNRRQRFINKTAMYEWRKAQNREMINCLNCGKPFERYKNILHPKTHKPTQYCSNTCNRSSDEKRKKLKNWGLSDKNHWRKTECQKKVGETKFVKYGDSKYNNHEKSEKTCIDRYGVACPFDIPSSIKSNGKRISKFQKRIYDKILIDYPDAICEKYLQDARCSVDIYILSIKKVIECHGDYWHCNPSKCSPDYYNTVIHKTAQEIWDRDNEKKAKLEQAGYTVEIIWENSNKKFRPSLKPSYL